MFSSNGSQVNSSVNYIDDAFSTYTYEGNNVLQPITNDIALGSTAAWSTQTLVHSTNSVSPSDTVTDSSGNIYQVGGRGNGTGFVVKYNSSFVIQWHKEITPTPSSCIMHRVTVDSSGNVFVAGTVGDGTSSENQLVLFKFNSSGTLQWQSKLGTARAAEPRGISVDSSGNIRVSGYVQQSANTQSMLLKFASDGSLTWQRYSSNTGCESYGKHAVDGSGNTYMGVFTYGGDYHSFGVLQKWDTSGNLTWQRQIDVTSYGGGQQSVVMDSAGDIYVAGSWNVSGVSSATLAKYNSSGTLQWRRFYRISASYGSGMSGQGIATDGTYIYFKVNVNAAYAGYSYPVTLFKISNTGTTVSKTGIFHKASSNFNTGTVGNHLAVSPDASTLYVGSTVYNATPLYQSNIITIPTAFGVSGKALYNLFGGGFHTDAAFTAGTESAASISTGTSTYTSSTPTYSFSNASNYTLSSENQLAVIGSGGLVWVKARTNGYNHGLIDTVRGKTKELHSNTTAAQDTTTAPDNGVTHFNVNGFTLGVDEYTVMNSGPGIKYVSWTYRKQPKFFDVVTYTGNGTTQNIAHNLGSVPGCIIVKKLTGANSNWPVYHRSLNGGVTPENYYLYLGVTDGTSSSPSSWNNTAPTSTTFTVGNAANVNGSGESLVAYLFAHDAGGFGLTGADNVISCGSFTKTDSWPNSAPVVLGWEPQFLIFKRIDTTGENWNIADIIRGDGNHSGPGTGLIANDAIAETTTLQFSAKANGFTIGNSTSIGGTYVYIAIRRPMKVPTDGTKVFSPVARTGTGTNNLVVNTTNRPDMVFPVYRDAAARDMYDRLRGAGQTLITSSTSAENNNFPNYGPTQFGNTSYTQGNIDGGGYNASGLLFVDLLFTRAPGFFDEVCYSGTGAVGNAISHNLGVAPELVIFKGRTGTVGASNWSVFTQFTGTNYVRAFLQLTDAGTTFSYTINAGIAATPTSTTITVDNVANLNNGSTTYVAYLFASAPGVSKVGSYTGNGTTQTINCGFTAGARFILIKRTDSTGDWYVWDTARGIVAGNDPYLLLNSTAAEVTSTDYIDTYSAGFEISSTAPAAINASGGTYIFLAIA